MIRMVGDAGWVAHGSGKYCRVRISIVAQHDAASVRPRVRGSDEGAVREVGQPCRAARAWEEQARSARGFKRVGRHSEYAI